MAVNFPSDIIMDVARAADPVAAGRARQRLASMASGAGFSEMVDGPARPAPKLSRTADGQKAHDVAKDFESVLVANMIEDMMGDGEQGYFGGGFAGGVWKSMMAEQVAKQVVKHADFGVASKISQYYVRRGEAFSPVEGINNAESTPTENRSLDAARNATTQINRDFLHKILDMPKTGDKV